MDVAKTKKKFADISSLPFTVLTKNAYCALKNSYEINYEKKERTY